MRATIQSSRAASPVKRQLRAAATQMLDQWVRFGKPPRQKHPPPALSPARALENGLRPRLCQLVANLHRFVLGLFDNL